MDPNDLLQIIMCRIGIPMIWLWCHSVVRNGRTFKCSGLQSGSWQHCEGRAFPLPNAVFWVIFTQNCCEMLFSPLRGLHVYQWATRAAPHKASTPPSSEIWSIMQNVPFNTWASDPVFSYACLSSLLSLKLSTPLQELWPRALRLQLHSLFSFSSVFLWQMHCFNLYLIHWKELKYLY